MAFKACSHRVLLNCLNTASTLNCKYKKTAQKLSSTLTWDGIHLSNGLFFLESRWTATVCVYKLNIEIENLFAHAVAVIRLHLSQKHNPLLIFTLLKHFLQRIFNFFLISKFALSFGCVTINLTASWTALPLLRQVMWKENWTRGVNILFI